MLERSVEATARGLGAGRRRLPAAVRAARARLAERSSASCSRPLRPPRHPLLLARFGLSAVRSRRGLARSRFEGERARALLAGLLRALDAVAAGAGQRRLRDRARAERPRRRLAGGPRRLAAAGRRARWLTCARSAARIETGRRVGVARRAADGAGPVAARRDPAPAAAIAGDAPARRATGAGSRALPLRARRLQARLGARRADPVDGARGARGPGRCTSAARSTRSPRPSRPRRAGEHHGAAVRAARAAEPVRPHPGARRASTPPGPTATSRTARRAT